MNANPRHREIAVEHLLFGTLRYLARREPALVDELEASIKHLGDYGDDRDDEAVREVARNFLRSLRSDQAAGS